jgi:hypothetical protein
MSRQPTLNLVPPAPFPQPLASESEDIPPVIVDEADLPSRQPLPPKEDDDDDLQVEPLDSHPRGVDTGEGQDKVNDDGIIRDSLTLGELRKYVEGGNYKVKVLCPEKGV